MLQVNKVYTEPGREAATPDTLSAADALHIFLSFFRRQSSVLLFVPLLAIALGVIYLVTARPSFTARAQLIIDTPRTQTLQQQIPTQPSDSAQIDSQVEILKSESIATTVIKKLHLTENPEFTAPGDGLLTKIITFISGEISPPDPAPPTEAELSRRAMQAFKSRLTIERIRSSYVIEIAFRSFGAQLSAEIANEIADAYIVDQLDVKYKTTRRASAWLQDRISELRKQLSDAELAVVQFKKEHNIVTTGGNDRPLLNQQQVAELSSQLIVARAQTADTRARLDRINSVLKNDPSEVSLGNDSFGATVADTLRNEIVTRLRAQFLEYSARVAEWTKKYGPDHLAVLNLRTRLREIRTSIFEELKRLGETYESDYEIAKQRELEVKKALELAIARSQETDVDSITLRELQSTAETYKTIYTNFLQHYMEAVQQQSFPISESRVITAASEPLQKSHPKTPHVLAIAWLGGMILGFGIAIVRDLSDRVFRKVEQVESLLHTNCLALVPQAQPDDAGSTSTDQTRTLKLQSENGNSNGLPKVPSPVADNNGSTPDNDAEPVAAGVPSDTPPKPPRRKLNAREGGLLRAIVDAPLSRFSESIRSIKLAIDLNGAIKTNQIIGITSSLPSEGKSTIAFSVAQLAASVGARTILVDCDLRNPSLSRALTPRAKAGLIDVITDKVSFEKAIWEDPSTNMVFLPVVVKFRYANSTEILASAPVKKLFEQLQESFDYIIVDLPPLAPIVDVRATTALISSFVFVIEWGRTKIDVVEHALGQAQEVYDKMLGVVLNKVDMTSFGRYASHHGGYYYNKHYGRYGYTD